MSIARKPKLLVFAVVIVVIIVNALLFGGSLTAWVSGQSGKWLAPVVQWTVHLRARIGDFAHQQDLALQNEALKKQLVLVQAKLAEQEEIQRQLAFYRAAADIHAAIGRSLIEAGIFSYPEGGGMMRVMINQGASEGIVAGDAVMTPEGAFIGTVENVHAHSSDVRMIGDPLLEFAGRILGTNISGILRGTRENSLLLDLIQKDEQVTEGMTVVTSGDDLYPAGLVVGTVRSVENGAALLFKTVRVTPAVSKFIAGKVIVIHP